MMQSNFRVGNLFTLMAQEVTSLPVDRRLQLLNQHRFQNVDEVHCV